MPKANRDIKQEVTNQIIALLDDPSAEKWSKSWTQFGNSLPTNIASGKKYNGLNILILWSVAADKGYGATAWGTYKQWQAKGHQVRKGEKSTTVIFYKLITVEDKETGEERNIPLLRAFNVFNGDQVEGYEEAPKEKLNDIEANTLADQIAAELGVIVKHGGDRAYFDPRADYVQSPLPGQFDNAESYALTLLHEITHWTGGEKRLGRISSTGSEGDEDYAFEELVAELGAAFLGASLGISVAPRPDHAAYIKSWLKRLKNDKEFIFKAASQAQKAVKWIEDNRKPVKKAA